ncbi:TspO/MBR family protein [Fictibacillus phosphorivorans]|uniref:TspO/MBR family protein n=1 Tax=Fictibacillus phosphorivorans TaxID=1221500 RepID=UPI002040AA07|nr:TspO/MBR family protein [Fictibacillus phosphorivorans]MCM3719329.1 tryptophan-rich sensory protein [Fictibacillus phosphorivorans]MCM3776950.1 tryptophan-rich sensory protein [Fictibacillus phosphorivorans]
MSEKLRAYMNMAALGIVILVNYLANALPINGNTTGALSEKYNVLITPSGYAFSIWGLIYTLLAIWVIYQAMPKQINHPAFKSIGYWFVINCFFNTLWVFVWHNEQLILSLVVMIGLLLSLMMIYSRIKGVEDRPKFILIPFSFYLGWVSVATIVNTSIVLKYSGWDGFGVSSETWTITMLIVGMVLAFAFIFKNNDLIYPLVFVWAFIGIGIRHMGDLDSIANTSFSLAVSLLLFIIWRTIKRTKSLRPVRT